MSCTESVGSVSASSSTGAETSIPESSSTSNLSSGEKYLDRMKRLRELHTRRNEAKKLNHAEVVEEDRRSKLPTNYEAKKLRQQWELEEIEKQKNAEAKGLDYQRVKLMETQADIAEKLEISKSRKKNPHTEHKDFETMTLRAYSRNVKNIQHPAGHYDTMKKAMGSDFYPTANTLIQGSYYPDKDKLDKLADDIVKQKEKRQQFQRKRSNDDKPVDYINEKNRRYNETVERFYGKYTEEIKQSLERGTAI